MWIRFFLEIYFELLMSSILGYFFIQMVPSDRYTIPDKVSIYLNYMTTFLVISIPITVGFLTIFIVRGRVRRKMQKRLLQSQKILSKLKKSQIVPANKGKVYKNKLIDFQVDKSMV